MPPKQAESERDGVINPKNYNFNKFKYGNFLCSQNATSQPKSTVELGYMCQRKLSGAPTVTLSKYLKYRNIIYLDIYTILNQI